MENLLRTRQWAKHSLGQDKNKQREKQYCHMAGTAERV